MQGRRFVFRSGGGDQARSQGGCGSATHHPKSAKRFTFSHKIHQKCCFSRGLRGEQVARFKKSTFWIQKVHIWGVLHLPKIDHPAYGPAYKCLCPINAHLVMFSIINIAWCHIGPLPVTLWICTNLHSIHILVSSKHFKLNALGRKYKVEMT